MHKQISDPKGNPENLKEMLDSKNTAPDIKNAFEDAVVDGILLREEYWSLRASP